jgi:hypothetical protein
MRIILKIEFFLIIRALNISYKKKNFSLIRSMIWLFRKYGYNVNKVYELQVIVKYDFAFKAKVDTKQNYMTLFAFCSVLECFELLNINLVLLLN